MAAPIKRTPKHKQQLVADDQTSTDVRQDQLTPTPITERQSPARQ
jgi:hypothetical protein